jgi:hypothetical protein
VTYNDGTEEVVHAGAAYHLGEALERRVVRRELCRHRFERDAHLAGIEVPALSTIDEAAVEAFVGRAVGDLGGAMTTLFCALGDRLGLLQALDADGPVMSEDLAARLGLNERYVREWLRGMTAAGYLEYEPDSQCFSLPAEHAPVLAQETGPVFFGGVYQELIGSLAALPRVTDALRAGGGTPHEAYPSDLWEGVERFTASWFENLLLSEWRPAVPEVRAKLEQGANVADVGCRAGRALIKLAGAFPNSRCSGYDAFDGQLDRARQNAASAGHGDRVTFERRDGAAEGLPDRFDLITTFDVVHDAVDPLALLKAIRAGLKPGGTHCCSRSTAPITHTPIRVRSHRSSTASASCTA